MKSTGIELELRYKRPGIETFETIWIPANTDASELLRILGANDIMRNEEMPFSGDIRTVGCQIREGKLQSGMYTVYGPRDIEGTARERVRGKYPALNR